MQLRHPIRTVDFDTHTKVTNLIYDGISMLDRKDFKGWLDLCTADFEYEITAWSPEIRKEMAWLRHDLEGMVHLIKLLPRHNTDQSSFTRHTTVYKVEPLELDERGKDFNVVSAVAVYRTALDGGATSLFAVGTYLDVVSFVDEEARLRSRTVRLETRALGIGTHYPL
jgi:methanesulfonate monooxygenase subunit beta